VAALAAVTPGTVPFIFAALGIAALGIGGPIAMSLLPGPGGANLSAECELDSKSCGRDLHCSDGGSYPPLQYGARRTAFSRMFLAGGACAAAAVFVAIPSSLAVMTQTWLSKRA